MAAFGTSSGLDSSSVENAGLPWEKVGAVLNEGNGAAVHITWSPIAWEVPGHHMQWGRLCALRWSDDAKLQHAVEFILSDLPFFTGESTKPAGRWGPWVRM